MSGVVLAAGALAAKTAESQKAGPLWLVTVLLLCIACYFLFKSMSKHLRNVRENFPPSGPELNRTSVDDPIDDDRPAGDRPAGDRPAGSAQS